MKKITYVLFALCWLSSAALQAQTVTIPNANFRAYLLADTSINTNSDSFIQVSEATAFNGTIDCSNLGITDFTGIAAFTNLNSFWCVNNGLTTLDLSANTRLTSLYANNNQLTSFDASSLTLLYTLSLAGNQLTSLDVSHNTSLQGLYVQINHLTTIDVSNLTSLTQLYLGSNQLISLSVSNNTLLRELTLQYNQLDTLDVSNNPNLTILFLTDNQISHLDLSNNSQLNTLNCSGNQLLTINLSNASSLVNFGCEMNNLTSLDVSACPLLKSLSCSNNQLSSLDVSNNIKLETFICDGNQLTSLDLRADTALIFFGCANSPDLSSINIQNGQNTRITTFVSVGCPNLYCVQVDDSLYSETHWRTNGNVGSSTVFSADCSALPVPTGFDKLSDANMDIQVFPNPTTDHIWVQLSRPTADTKIELINLLGEVIHSEITSNSSIQLALPDTKGVYLVRVSFGQQSFVKRIVKY